MNWYLLVAADGNIGPFYASEDQAIRMRRALPGTLAPGGSYHVAAPMFVLDQATNQWTAFTYPTGAMIPVL